MKRYSKTLVAILLAVTLTFSTTAVTFAFVDGDPVGHCSTRATHEHMIHP